MDLKNIWDGLIGGEQTSTTSTTTEATPKSNTGLIVAGVAILVVAVFVVIYLFGNKNKATA